MFEITAQDQIDSKQIPILPPGIYHNFELVSVKIEKAEKKDGTVGKNLLNFEFRGPNGETHLHSEWEITQTDNGWADKAKNMAKRIAHIMVKFLPVEKLVQNSPDWTSYAQWVIRTLGTFYKGVKVDFKVIGNVYNDKASSGFPQYIGFIVKAGEPLSLSSGEIAKNQEYFNFLEAKRTAKPEEGTNAPAVSEDAF